MNEAMISLRDEMIGALDARLTDDIDNSEYALSALALTQLLEGRAAELNRLETFRAETPEPYAMPQDLTIEVDRIGRSPLLLSVLVFLGSGFVVLIVVFVGQGLKQAKMTQSRVPSCSGFETGSCSVGGAPKHPCDRARVLPPGQHRHPTRHGTRNRFDIMPLCPL